MDSEQVIKSLGVGLQAPPVEFLTIKNNFDVPQMVVHKGQQYRLGPHVQETMDADLARVFLERCAPVVTKVAKEPNKALAPGNGPTGWVANVRGSPRFPEKVKVWQRNHQLRRLEQVEVENPKRAALPISREYDFGQEERRDPGGQMAMYNLPKLLVEVPPRTRVELPMAIASWFMARDNRQTEEMRGCAINSRAPSDFEPTTRWGLDDIRNYLRYLDPDAKLGPDEESLKKKKFKNPAEAQAALRKAKNELLDVLFDYLADPRYRLPSKEEFEEFVTGKPASIVEEEEIARLLGESEAAQAE